MLLTRQHLANVRMRSRERPEPRPRRSLHNGHCGLLLLALTGITVLGCFAPRQVRSPSGQSTPCDEPAAYVFTAAGIDARFAKSTFGQIVTGDIDIKSDPRVISLASQAATDERIRAYLRCLAIHRDHYTHAQTAYFESLSGFLTTKPSAAQFIEWQSANPFPAASLDNSKTDPEAPKKLEPMIQQESHGPNSPNIVGDITINPEVNPNRQVVTYNCLGDFRVTKGPLPNVGMNIEANLGDQEDFLKMARLNDAGDFQTLLDVCSEQLTSKPGWQTPYLFCSLAYGSLGDKTKAREMLGRYDSKSGPAYAGDCERIAKHLHDQLDTFRP